MHGQKNIKKEKGGSLYANFFPRHSLNVSCQLQASATLPLLHIALKAWWVSGPA